MTVQVTSSQVLPSISAGCGVFFPAVADDEIDHQKGDERQEENADDQNIEKDVIDDFAG